MVFYYNVRLEDRAGMGLKNTGLGRVGLGSGLGWARVGLGSGSGRAQVGLGSGSGRARVGLGLGLGFILRAWAFAGQGAYEIKWARVLM
jgi:hypothetical protein